MGLFWRYSITSLRLKSLSHLPVLHIDGSMNIERCHVGLRPEPSPAEFQDAVDSFMNQPPALLGSSGGAGFIVEFPYGDQSSLCQAMADQPHPRYGNGLFVLQSFPVKAMSDTDGVKLALSMNRIELTQRPFGYGFGSYAYKDSALHFTSLLFMRAACARDVTAPGRQ